MENGYMQKKKKNMSKEIACYSLDIPTDEFFDDMSFVPNYEKLKLFDDLKGFLGVNIDYRNGIIHHLFDTPKHRNQACQKVKSHFRYCAVNLQTCYVDKKYLKK